MVDPQINLGQIVGKDHKYELSVSNESPEDAAARRAAEAADAELKRRMTFGVFLFALAVTAVVFSGCVYVFANGTPDDKKWASAIVSAIASGLVGFLVGQGKK
ncbi:hypothetical protein [Methylocaldum sp.]|uniref:hypothetical protein n=1 Tax=Methylocaldum sp. TaxID=1969727 RepID=UPI002D284221|nr:hypothetical protein [Methylocaldum sp.]HYE35520.1 hypothetical protein [Methylocaldum sp.]